jgi:hypothetical protein
MLETMEPMIRVGYNKVKKTPEGLDKIAYTQVVAQKIPFVCHPADWRAGKDAGMKRNREMVVESDYVVGFWDGISAGTANCIYHGWFAKKLARVYLIDGRVLEGDSEYLQPRWESLRLPPLDPLLLGEEKVKAYLDKVGLEQTDAGLWWHTGLENPVKQTVAYMWHIRNEPPIEDILSEFV